MRWFKHVLLIVFWVGVLCTSLIYSASFHLSSKLGRHVVRNMVNSFVSKEIKGDLSIGQIEKLSLDRAVVKNVKLYDHYGRVVGELATAIVYIDVPALAFGVLRFPSILGDQGRFTLIEDPTEGGPTLINCLAQAKPSRGGGGGGINALVDTIWLHRSIVQGEFLGVKNVLATGVRAKGSLTDIGGLRVDIHSAQMDVEKPFGIKGSIDDISGTIFAALERGINLRIKAHYQNEQIQSAVTWRLPSPRALTPELGLRVEATPVSANTLVALGFDWANAFNTNLRGHFALTGPIADLKMSANLITSGGPLWLEGSIQSERAVELVIHGSKDKLPLIFKRAPEVELSGQARLYVDLSPTRPKAPLLQVDAEPFFWNNIFVPALHSDIVFEEKRFLIKKITSPHLKGQLTAHGQLSEHDVLTLNYEIELTHIENEANIKKYVPEAHGSIQAEGTFSYDITREQLKFDSIGSFTKFRYAIFRSESLNYEASGHGKLHQLVLDINSSGKQVAFDDFHYSDLTFSISGGPQTYQWKAHLGLGPDQSIAGEGSAQATPQGYTFQSNDLVMHRGPSTWHGNLATGEWNELGSWSVQGLTLVAGSQRLAVEAKKESSGAFSWHADVQDFDLKAVASLIGQHKLDATGHVDANVTWLIGANGQDQWSISGTLHDATYQTLRNVDVNYYLTKDRDVFSYDLAFEFGDQGSASTFGTATVDTERGGLIKALMQASYVGQAQIRSMDLKLIRTIFNQRPVWPGGKLSAQLNYRGTRDAPEFSTQFDIEAFRWASVAPLDIAGRIHHSPTETKIDALQVSDEHGLLIETNGMITGNALEAWQHDQLRSFLASAPWKLSAHIPSRRSTELPSPFSLITEDDVQGSATLQLQNDENISGKLETSLQWLSTPMVAACARNHRPTIQIKVDVDRNFFHGTLETRDRRRQLLQVQAAAFAPLHDWIEHGLDITKTSLELDGRVARVLLEDIPWLCEYGSGPVDASFRAVDILTDKPKVSAHLQSGAMRMHYLSDPERSAESLPVQLQVDVNTDDAGSLVMRGLVNSRKSTVNERRCGYLLETHKQSTERHCPGFKTRFEHGICVDGQIPLDWKAGVLIPTRSKNKALKLLIDLEQAHLEPIFALLPWIEQGDGHAQGQLSLSSVDQKNDFKGRVAIEKGCMQVVNLGAHLSELTGHVLFNGPRAMIAPIAPLRARDQSGTITISGPIDFRGLRPERVDFQIDTNRFPLRREGSPVAELSGTASLRAHMTETRTDAKVEINKLRMLLPDEGQRALQGIESHSDVYVVGNNTITDIQEASYPYHLMIDARKPFTVQRSDFSASVAGALDALYDAPDLVVKGYIQILRGYFAIFGKRFTIQRGSLRFEGTTDLNPTVDILASYAPRGQQSDTIIVTVSGQLLNPQVDFSSSNPSITDRGEIIAMLVSGRSNTSRFNQGDTQAASQQASSFLAGLTAGMLTLTARKELGDIVPNIALESSQTNTQRGRIRIGWNIDELIRKRLGFLGNFVQGAYVEGVISTSMGGSGDSTDPNQTIAGGGTSRSTVGGLIELYFPSNFVGSMLMSPPDNFGIDVTWEP